MKTKGIFSSASNEWSTPQWLYDQLNAEFHFKVDVCATPENAKHKRYFTEKDDGLKQQWHKVGGACWMNPPYGRQVCTWVKKAYEESLQGATVVCLVAARTDTKWWNDYCLKGEIRFIRGRLRFQDSKNNAPFPSAIVIFRPKEDPMQHIRFYKIAQKQFGKDADERLKAYSVGNECKWAYSSVKLPNRSTTGSAGYDFYSPVHFKLYPGETIIIPSGLCCEMPSNIFLAIFPRSSVAIKYGITLLNTIAVIDADYFNNDNNGGHILLGFKNTGDKVWEVDIGDRICQGIFLPYAITEDDDVTESRNGGIGSTGV